MRLYFENNCKHIICLHMKKMMLRRNNFPNRSRKQVRVVSSVLYVSESKYSKKIIDLQGAYAINRIYVIFDNPECTEEYVDNFLEDFRKVGSRFYNLQEISIKAPFAIYTGDMVKKLVNTKGTFTRVDLTMFGFHSPTNDMWVPENDSSEVKHVSLTFTDGIAYPNSASNILLSVCKHPYIKDIDVCNNSPHMPTVIVNKKTSNKLRRVTGVGIKVKKR